MKMKSVQSLNPCKSVIQTIYDIVKAHGGSITVNSFNSPEGGPPAGSISVISNYREPGELKVESNEGEGSKFTLQIPVA